MYKCRYCNTKMPEEQNSCNVCGIEKAKNKKDLTNEEKNISYCCKAMHTIGFLDMLFGGIVAFGLFIAVMSGEKIPLFNGGLMAILMAGLIGIFFLYFGFSLMRYRKWCYYTGITIYGFGLIMNLISFNLFGVVVSGVFLYFIVNPTSKKILHRTLEYKI